MNTILWTQNENPLTPSTLVIDGVRSEFEGTKKQNEAMRVISSTSSWISFNIEGTLLVVKYKDGEGYLVSSCFNNKDEAGRPMPFSYYSNNNDFFTVVDELRDDLKQLDREYSWEELSKECCEKIVSEIEKVKKKRMVLKLGLGVAVLALLTYLILSVKSKTCLENSQPNNQTCDSTEQININCNGIKK